MKPIINCDLLVVGGGIHGAGIARDATGRGLSVVLCESDDLGAHTSSASTRLIHGTLRYLEGHDFGLVRKALLERDVLMRSAPHIISPLRFALPQDAGQRPAWVMRAGLLFCNRLARHMLLPASRYANLLQHVAGSPLRLEFLEGYLFSDAWVDDARLVVLNAMAAAEAGATILTRTVCDSAQRIDGHWQATLHGAGGTSIPVCARALVNATGPWAARFLRQASGAVQPLRLVKGSHIVVRKKFGHGYAYLFQHPHGHTVFALPYEQDYTLIGATELDYSGDPASVAISDEEISLLCNLVNRYFTARTSPADVVWSCSGVRPLLEEDSSHTPTAACHYRLRLDDNGGAPLLSVLGGAISTFRKLAEEAVDLLGPRLGRPGGAWTANACLPGGDLYGMAPSSRGVLGFDDYLRRQKQRYGWMPRALLERYARAYGTRMDTLLAGCGAVGDLGLQVQPELYEAELHYLTRHEWARTAEDVLWRRSRLGLRLGPDAARVLDAWMVQTAMHVSAQKGAIHG
ncbi:MAG: glycerol-3-phosphate dehydrogenase [Noviherbaspirillum sp.]